MKLENGCVVMRQEEIPEKLKRKSCLSCKDICVEDSVWSTQFVYQGNSVKMLYRISLKEYIRRVGSEPLLEEDKYIVWEKRELPEEFRNMPEPLKELQGAESLTTSWTRHMRGDGGLTYYRMLKTDYERLRKDKEVSTEKAQVEENTKDECGLTLSEALVALGQGETLISKNDVRLFVENNELFVHYRGNKVRSIEDNVNKYNFNNFKIMPPEPMDLLTALDKLETDFVKIEREDGLVSVTREIYRYLKDSEETYITFKDTKQKWYGIKTKS